MSDATGNNQHRNAKADQEHNAKASKQLIAALLTEVALIKAFDTVQVDILLEETRRGEE